MNLSASNLLMWYAHKRKAQSNPIDFPIVNYGAGPFLYYPFDPVNLETNRGTASSFSPSFTKISEATADWSSYPYVTNPEGDGLVASSDLVRYNHLGWDQAYTAFPSFGDDFTVCLWLSPNGRSQGGAYIIGQADQYSADSTDFFKIRGYHDSATYSHPDDQPFFQAETSITFSDGTDLSVYALDTIPNTDLDIHWFVFRVSKNNFMDIWIDGEMSGTYNLPTKEFNRACTHDFSFGEASSDLFLNNDIRGEFRFYDRLMPQEEIWQLYFQYTGIDKRP